MEAQIRMHKQALEAALNSVVRLCVVAPTVNVHMGDKTQTFKAPLPQSKLKGFVEGQVLPKFAKVNESWTLRRRRWPSLSPMPRPRLIPPTLARNHAHTSHASRGLSQIFVQPKEGSSPNGDPLDKWLQNLLVEMQGTIERHLTKLFAQVKT